MPLRVLLVGLEKGPEFEVLEGMGHRVDHPASSTMADWSYDDLGVYDLILGPRCWRILPEHLKFLPLAIKEARARAKAARPKKSSTKKVKEASHT